MTFITDPKTALAAIEAVCATIHPDIDGYFDVISEAIAKTREELSHPDGPDREFAVFSDSTPCRRTQP